MLPFQFDTATDESTALDAGADGARYLAGGTTLVDLMRQTVERPERVIDINGLPYRDIDLNSTRLRVGALVRMSELAANPQVRLPPAIFSQNASSTLLERAASPAIVNACSASATGYSAVMTADTFSEPSLNAAMTASISSLKRKLPMS